MEGGGGDIFGYRDTKCKLALLVQNFWDFLLSKSVFGYFKTMATKFEEKDRVFAASLTCS